ncbi:hypothetical protein [Streptomyces bacillaris]|uniref:hypothetical protein n=1 Tax=Streptomyces bacillaris TaxID=68179 RepID=UPI00363E0E93
MIDEHRKTAEACQSGATATAETNVTDVLLAVANHFTATHPTAPLERNSLLIAFDAEAYNLLGRSTTSSNTLARAALAMAPARTPGVTRGEYALILRRTAAEAGNDRPDDRPIPGIPGPRTGATPVKGGDAR